MCPAYQPATPAYTNLDGTVMLCAATAELHDGIGSLVGQTSALRVVPATRAHMLQGSGARWPSTVRAASMSKYPSRA